jgi:hypothetical protein
MKTHIFGLVLFFALVLSQETPVNLNYICRGKEEYYHCDAFYEGSCYQYHEDHQCTDIAVTRLGAMFPKRICEDIPDRPMLVHNLKHDILATYHSPIMGQIRVVNREVMMETAETEDYRQLVFGNMSVETSPIQGKRRLFKDGDFSKTLRFPYINSMIVYGLVYNAALRRYTKTNETSLEVLNGGIGVGALPQFFADFIPGAKVDVVDIDEYVIEVAQDWFEFRTEAMRKVVAQDVKLFLKETKSKYDIIYIDAFSAHGIPSGLYTDELAIGLKSRIKKHGVVICNTFENESTLEQEYVWDMFRRHFDHVDILAGSNEDEHNMIAVAYDGDALDYELLVDTAVLLEERNRDVDFGFNMVDVLLNGWETAEPL